MKASVYAGLAMAVLSAIAFAAQIVIQGTVDWGIFAALALAGANTIMGSFYLALGSLIVIVGLVSGLKNKKCRR